MGICSIQGVPDCASLFVVLPLGNGDVFVCFNLTMRLWENDLQKLLSGRITLELSGREGVRRRSGRSESETS